MKINQKIAKLAMVLFIITMALFFLLFYLFSTRGDITDADYFNYSAIICSFILPPIYAGVAFYGVYGSAKKEVLSFQKALKLGFIPMFVGGLLSLASIFIFFNTTGEWAQDSLKRGLVELRYGNIDEQTMLEEGDKIMAEKEAISNMEYNLFSGKNFFIYYSMILFYYLVIGVLFAQLFKNKRV